MHLLSWSSEGPNVIGVMELVARDLLLVAGATPIRVLQRVGVVMGVEPTRQVRLTEAESGAIAKYCGKEEEEEEEEEREKERGGNIFSSTISLYKT